MDSKNDNHDDHTPLDCKVYVGELGNDGNRTEIENAFSFYGSLKDVWVARNPPGFAFVMFQHSQDARDATRALDGKVICGRRVKVELSNGKSRHELKAPYSRSGGSSRSDSSRYPRDGGDRSYRDSNTRPHSSYQVSRSKDNERSGYLHHRGGYARSRSRSPFFPPSKARIRSRTPPPTRSRSPNSTNSVNSYHYHHGEPPVHNHYDRI